MTDVQFRFRKGAGSNLDVLFGTVTLKPTLAHSRGTSMVLPAPSTWDIINGEVLATNVQPTPEPVEGQIEWGYEVTVKDRHGKSYSFLVGVPDSTTAVEFVSLPRYFETKPPLFGQGPQGIQGPDGTPGKSAYQYAVEGGYSGTEEDFAAEQLRAGEAVTEAERAARESEEARIAAETALGRIDAPTDEVVSDLIGRETSLTQDALDNKYATKRLATGSYDGLMPHTDKTKLDSATSLSSANTVVIRDSNGRAKFSSPQSTSDAANKGYVDEVADTKLSTNVSKLLAGVGAGTDIPKDYDIGLDGTVIALGFNAMSRMTQVKKSIAIGPYALGEGTISRDNVAIGEDALRFTQAVTPNYSQTETDGTRLVAIGGNSLRFNEHGVGHVAIGRNAGQNIVGGTGLVAIGNGAHASQCPIGLSGKIENWSPSGGAATATYNVTAIGQWALAKNTSWSATAVGAYALREQVVSAHNVAIGSNTLRRIDEDAWFNGGTKYDKNITGTYTHSGNTLTVNATSHGAAVGDVVLIRLTSGGSQTFAGDVAPANVIAVPNANSFQVSHPISRTASGASLLVSVVKPGSPSKAEMNTAVGTDVLPYLKSGNYNIGFGYRAGFNLASGQSNIYIGFEAGSEIASANQNTSVGTQALKGASGSTAKENTAVGYQALQKVTDGSYNVAVGVRAGFELTGGQLNTSVGYSAGRTSVSGGNMQGFSNVTCIGSDSRISGNDQVQLGNSSTTTYVYGTVQNRSDRRDKADIRDTSLGLEFISKLRPVDFRWDMRDDYLVEDSEGNLTKMPRDGSKKRSRYHHGLIAQEVAAVANSMGVDFGGYQDHSLAGGDDVLSIGYDELIAPLIRAVQELSQEVTKIKESSK